MGAWGSSADTIVGSPNGRERAGIGMLNTHIIFESMSELTAKRTSAGHQRSVLKTCSTVESRTCFTPCTESLQHVILSCAYAVHDTVVLTGVPCAVVVYCTNLAGVVAQGDPPGRRRGVSWRSGRGGVAVRIETEWCGTSPIVQRTEKKEIYWLPHAGSLS